LKARLANSAGITSSLYDEHDWDFYKSQYWPTPLLGGEQRSLILGESDAFYYVLIA
jgi:hypothetical protein